MSNLKNLTDTEILASRIIVKCQYRLGRIAEDQDRAIALHPTTRELEDNKLKPVPGARVVPASRYFDPISGQRPDLGPKIPDITLSKSEIARMRVVEPENRSVTQRIKAAWKEFTR